MMFKYGNHKSMLKKIKGKKIQWKKKVYVKKKSVTVKLYKRVPTISRGSGDTIECHCLYIGSLTTMNWKLEEQRGTGLEENGTNGAAEGDWRVIRIIWDQLRSHSAPLTALYGIEGFNGGP